MSFIDRGECIIIVILSALLTSTRRVDGWNIYILLSVSHMKVNSKLADSHRGQGLSWIEFECFTVLVLEHALFSLMSCGKNSAFVHFAV